MGARNVVVVMPFGGRNGVERRRAILNFKRLEYLVRYKCHVISANASAESVPVSYSVEVVSTATGDIPERALRQIENADILIALVAERNPNVIYEIAHRRARDRTVLLVVDSTESLPLYLNSVAYQTWKQEKVLDRIKKIAEDDLPELPDFAVGIPNDLKEAIDKFDTELARGLEEALQEIEASFKPPQTNAVTHLRGIVSDETASFYPSSVVEITFSGRNEFADAQYPARVCNFDDGFVRLYGYVASSAAEADQPLTLAKLAARLQPFCDPGDWKEFIDEQCELTEAVIKHHGFARASVPLRINTRHPRAEYRGTSYLPCIIAQVTDGSLDGFHRMYLLVVYIELAEKMNSENPEMIHALTTRNGGNHDY